MTVAYKFEPLWSPESICTKELVRKERRRLVGGEGTIGKGKPPSRRGSGERHAVAIIACVWPL